MTSCFLKLVPMVCSIALDPSGFPPFVPAGADHSPLFFLDVLDILKSKCTSWSKNRLCVEGIPKLPSECFLLVNSVLVKRFIEHNNFQ